MTPRKDNRSVKEKKGGRGEGIFWGVSILVVMGLGAIQSLLIVAHYPLGAAFISKAIFICTATLCWAVPLLLLLGLCDWFHGKMVLRWIWAAVVVGYCAASAHSIPWSRVAEVNSSQQQSSSAKTGSQSLPNLVLVVIDTLRADRLGCYGHPLMKTPTMDLLARLGIQCEHVVSSIPITAASHATMFTGLLPYQHGIRYNGVPLVKGCRTLAQRLAEKGVFTAAVVSSEAVNGEITQLQRGFALYDDRFWFSDVPAWWQFVFPLGPMVVRFHHPPPERRADATLARLKGLLPVLQKKQPFFLWAHFYDPHIPYDPPSPYNVMYREADSPPLDTSITRILSFREPKHRPGKEEIGSFIALYQGEVSFADHILGELWHALQSMRGGAPLKMLVTADHGESLSEHDYYFYHGEKLYQPSLRVPLLIVQQRGSEVVGRPGKVVTSHLSLSDIPDMLLFKTPWRKEVSSAKGEAGKANNHQHSEDMATLHAVAGDTPTFLRTLEKPWNIAENGTLFFITPGRHDLELKSKTYAIQSREDKLIVHPDGRWEIYDLTNDAQELHDLGTSGDHWSKQQTVLKNRLQALIPEMNRQSAPITVDDKAIEPLKSLGYIDE